MKHAEKLPSRGASSSSSPPPTHRLSHAIAKAPPPKIVHLLAPEIIKTEARHFRELVQRLTGMPPKKRSCASSASTGGDASPSPSPQTSVSSYDTTGNEGLGPGAGAGAAAGTEMKMKEEAETSSSGGEGGGFLRALELDGYVDGGFYQGLDDFLFSSCDMGGF